MQASLLSKIKDWVLDRIGREISIDQFASVILPYKGYTTVDSAAFYCPYVPIISTSIVDTSVVYAPTGQTFTMREILEKYEQDQK